MGLLNHENILWLNVSCGNLVNKQKEIESHGYCGKLLEIREKQDEYDGQPVAKVQVKMADIKKDEIVVITFSKESWFSHGFFARIKKVDLFKEFILGVSRSDEKEKMSFCWIKQNNAVIKKDDAFPIPDKGTIGKKEIRDWTGVLETIDRIIPEINETLSSGAPDGSEPPSSSAGAGEHNKHSDDLPF